MENREIYLNGCTNKVMKNTLKIITRAFSRLKN